MLDVAAYLRERNLDRASKGRYPSVPENARDQCICSICRGSKRTGKLLCRNCGDRFALMHHASGGRVLASGYVAVMYPDHPRAHRNGLVLEHLLVMEEMLGRPVRSDETVHHKNGVRHDNRPENLELWASSHPPGQRTEDLVAHAVEILRRYRPELLSEDV